jgi:hypothetical protein
MDTVSLSVQTPRGEVQGLLLLPTHPLRASWVQNHDRTLRTWGATLTSHAKKTRKMQVEAKLVSKLTAANLPLFVGSRGTSSSGDFGSFVYAEEFTHGSAFYIPAHVQDSRSYVMALSSALGLNVQTKSTNLSSTLLAERIANYASSRVSHAGLRIKAVNPADGLILADALRKATDYLPEGMKLGRLEFDSYSSFVPLVHPLPALEQFQKEIENTDGKATANYLAPSCSIKVSKISELAKSTVKGNLAIVQGLSQLHISSAANVQQKSSSLGGLLTSTSTQVVDSEDGKRTFTFPSLETLNSKKASAITLTHLAFEQGLIRALNLQPGNLAVALNLGSDSISVLEQLHSNNDWVCTLDRYLGLSLYEEVLTGQLQKTNILDYAPDFVDGIGDRLTVTTTDRDEISDVLLDAMDKLGLTDEKGKPEDLLRTLSSVSGRLALRLFKKDTIAMEAIGLAATVMHLRKEEKLKNVILFPVDAHPDLFGVHARDSQDSAQRCDLIVIGFSGKKYFLDFIEVKARSNAIEVGLEKKMASQIQQTIRVLSQRLGLGDTTRIDNELQWSRWAGLLHFYADRSHLHGFISKSEISNIHAAIDQIEKNKEKPEIRKSGYIFSLTSNKDSIQELVDGVRMTLLDAATVENLGFETKIGKSLINDVE